MRRIATTLLAPLALVGSFVLSSPAGADPTTVPSPPLDLIAHAGPGSATISWSAPASNGGSPITGYLVIAHDITMASRGKESCSTTSTFVCEIMGLTNGDTYAFIAQAKNIVGLSKGSLASNRVIPATVPSAPTNIVVTPADRSLKVSWAAPYSNGGSPVTSYTATAYPSNQSCTTAGLSCTIGSLVDGSPYTVSVTASNQAGTSAPSPASSVVSPIAAPLPPRDVKVTVTSGYLTATWTPPASATTQPVLSYTLSATPSGQSCVTKSALSCEIYIGSTPNIVVTLVATTAFAASAPLQVYPVRTVLNISPFAKNSWSLPAKLRAQVQVAANRIYASGATHISIIGFASTSDNHSTAPATALARALIVASLLRSDTQKLRHSLAGLTITTKFQGWSGYLLANHALARNQRVLIEAS